MKQSKTYKMWQFENGNNNLHAVSFIHIVIWHKGIAIIGFAENKEVINARYFLFEKSMSADDAAALIIDEPLLGGDEPVTHIWLCHPSLLIVPKQLYKEELAINWMQELHFIAHDEHVITLPVLKPASYILFPIASSLHDTISKLFPSAIIDNLINASFSDNAQKNMTVSVLPNCASIATFDTKNLLHYTVFDFDNIDTIIYKITQIASEHHIDQAQLKIDIIGFGPDKDLLYDALQSLISIENKPESTFFNLLLACES